MSSETKQFVTIDGRQFEVVTVIKPVEEPEPAKAKTRGETVAEWLIRPHGAFPDDSELLMVVGDAGQFGFKACGEEFYEQLRDGMRANIAAAIDAERADAANAERAEIVAIIRRMAERSSHQSWKDAAAYCINVIESRNPQ